MKNNENNINILDELNKGACMGQDAINMIMEKVTDKNLAKVLKEQNKKYDLIINKIAKIYPNYSNKDPHETSIMNKAMTWYGIELKTLMDNSTSKITELLLQGTNMGIIEGRKLLNNKNTNAEIHSIIQEYVDMQEECVEKLKNFL